MSQSEHRGKKKNSNNEINEEVSEHFGAAAVLREKQRKKAFLRCGAGAGARTPTRETGAPKYSTK